MKSLPISQKRADKSQITIAKNTFFLPVIQVKSDIMEVNCLKEKLQKFNQEHLLQFWDEISDHEKSALFKDILELDLPEVTSYFAKAMNSLNANKETLDSKIQPIPGDVFESLCASTPAKLEQYELRGLKEVSEGRVAVLLMAGGQGTRLGVHYPKGMYDVGLPSHSTLFRLQALRIRRLQELAEEKFKKRGQIAWYAGIFNVTFAIFF